jgi:probable phosphoglycerate mutase
VAQAFAHIVALRAALPGSLAVVTHGLVIRALLANHLSSAESVPLKVGNTSVTIVAAHAPHGVELLDCTRHLVDSMQHKAGSLSGG